VKLQIALNSARGRATTLTAERLVNLFAEKAPEGAESTSVTHGAPGMVTHATIGSGPCRGLCMVGSLVFVVSGEYLYSLDRFGAYSVALGYIPGNNLVSMASDGDILVVVTNPAGYSYTVSTATFAQITDVAYLGAHSVIWMNQTFIFANDTEHFVGATGGLLPFDPLLAASAEYAPDAIIGIARDHNELLIYGESTLEAWSAVEVASATDYPFEAISGATGEKGLASRKAIAQIDNTTVWLDQNGIVRRLQAGYTPQRISTEAIEHQLAGAMLAESEMLVYILEGHEFFALNTDVGTFVFDANTGLWHERESYGLSRWKAQCSVYAWGDWYVGNISDGVISRLDLDVNDENGDDLVAQAVFPPVVFQRSRFTVHMLELGCDVGTGTYAVDPIVMLRTSRNGSTWSNGAQRGMGTAGQFDRRVIWRRLGQFDKVFFRLDISHPYKRAVYAAYAEVERDDR
jgi:hypothetical protein